MPQHQDDLIEEVVEEGFVPQGYHSPKRPASVSSSKFSFMSFGRSKSSQTKDYRIVVYDTLERKLWVDTEENIKRTEQYIKVPIRGTETKVAVYMHIGPKDQKAKVYIATVDLEKLGKWVKGQRKKMRMQHLYILGQVPKGLGPVEEEDG